MSEERMNISECIKGAIEDGMETGFVFGYLASTFGGADWPKLFAEGNERSDEILKSYFAKAKIGYKEFQNYKPLALALNLRFVFDVYKAVEEREQEAKES